MSVTYYNYATSFLVVVLRLLQKKILLLIRSPVLLVFLSLFLSLIRSSARPSDYRPHSVEFVLDAKKVQRKMKIIENHHDYHHIPSE